MVSKNAILLSAQPREKLGKKVNSLRKNGLLPAVIYGQKIKNLPLVLDLKEFEKVFAQAGEHSLITLKIEGQKEELPVLIHSFQKDPVSDKIIHVDFYKPNLEKKVKASVPLRIEGESPAVKNLEGTLIKNFSELEVKALPMDIPDEIIVHINSLETLGSEIFIKDLKVPEGVEILKDPEEVVALVAGPSRVEEELKAPIEEKIEEVEGVIKEGEQKKEEEKEEGSPEKKEEEKKE